MGKKILHRNFWRKKHKTNKLTNLGSVEWIEEWEKNEEKSFKNKPFDDDITLTFFCVDGGGLTG